MIGSGVGGLIAANLLVRAGLKVLLVEQHYMAGGYCSTFRRGGYTFDAATHFYPLLGNPDTRPGRLLVELGVETGWVKMDPVDVFHLPDGTRFPVDPDLDVYLARVKAEFPHQAAALDGFFAEVRECYLLGQLCYFRGREDERLGRFREMTVRQALDRWFDDHRLKLLLTADCPHWGSPPCRTSFVFDSMLRLSYFLGNYYPRGGSQAFVDDLALAFEERRRSPADEHRGAADRRRGRRGPRRRDRDPARRGALRRRGARRRRGLQRRPAADPRSAGRARAPGAGAVAGARLGSAPPSPAGSPTSGSPTSPPTSWPRPRATTGTAGTPTASASTPSASSSSCRPSTSRSWRRPAARC